jgi:hypothetical protein
VRFAPAVWAQDPGWPRKLVKPGGTVLVYQPQVDDWQNFTDIKWRAAFQLTPNGGKQIVGAASFEATTEVNTDNHTVLLFNISVTNTYFPGQDPATTPQFDQLFRSFVPLTLNASLDRLVAYMPKPQAVKTVNLRNDPPFIFVSYTPAILLGVDGEGSSKRDCLATVLTLSVIPLSEDWIPAYRNPAQQVVSLAVAASTLADMNAVPFLTNQFNNMRALTDKCLQMTKSMTYIDPNSLGGSCQ